MILYRKGRSNVLHRKGRSRNVSKIAGLQLDSFRGGLESAFSIGEQLLTSYKDKIIEVLEDDGSTTAEFGTVNGVLDTASLLTFVGANNGYVVGIYDQKSGVKTAISTSAQQILIVNAGSLVSYTAKYLLEIPQNTALTVSGIASCNRMKNLSMVDYIGFKGAKSIIGYSQDYVFPINCSAGLMDFSITNGSNVFWYLQDGTVSTSSRPGATLGTGVSYLFATNIINNNIDIHANNNPGGYIGNTKNLPRLTYILNLYNCTNHEGLISDLPRVTYLLEISGNAKLVGSTSDLSRVTYYLGVTSVVLMTGDIVNLPRVTDVCTVRNDTLLTGDISDFPKVNTLSSIYYCNLLTGSLANMSAAGYFNAENCNLLTGIYTPLPTSNNITLSGTNMSPNDTDQTLINLNTITATTGTIYYKNNRTSASDAAVAALIAKGWSLNPV